jgi:glycosyltransferase involved in cell wall biosynthesis
MPQHADFGWVRRWFPIDEVIPTVDGFLADDANAPGLTLEDVRNQPCLVLLGAPGTGKSREAEAAVRALRARGKAADLIAVGRRADPLDTLLGLLSADHATAWTRNGAHWHLFVDGIDEAFGAAAGFESALRTFLGALADTGGDLAKMRLRVLCRTVEWTASLDRLLAEHWDEHEILKLQIAPLTKVDVRLAVDAVSGDAGAAQTFLQRVHEIGAQALASRPVSMLMLAEIQRDKGELPAEQAELYRLALEALADEPNESRRGRRRRGALNAAETLAVAARIASATAFSGKSRVWAGYGPPPDPSAAFALREISGGTEATGPESFRVSEADLLDTVRTPLFEPAAPDTYVWGHQTFMEYLAARYLVDHGLKPDQVLNFLSVSDPQGARGIAPQWREIAAWAATLSRPVFELLIREEPDVLLQSDVAAASDADRKALVTALLARLEAEELVEIIHGLRPLFARLNYPGLATQLRAFVQDPTRGQFARRTAIDIAEETGKSELAEDFARLALAADTPIQLRKDAAYAVSRLGRAQAREMLAPLLRGDLLDDQDDELRGAALKALWPRHLSVQEMLEALTPEKQDAFIGTYHMFLRQLELGALSPNDALFALHWLGSQPLERDNGNGLQEVQAKVFWAAVACAENPTVREALSGFLEEYLQPGYSWLLNSVRDVAPRWPTSIAVRLAIVRETLARFDLPAENARSLLFDLPEILTPADLDATLQALTAEADPKVQEGLVELVTSLALRKPLDDLNAVFDAAKRVPKLGIALEALYFVPFGSSSEKWMRDSARHERETAAKLSERARGAQIADGRVQEALAAIDAGDVNMWWRLNMQLFVAATGRFEGMYEFQSDLTATPGWGRLSEVNHHRIIDTAIRYLGEGGPDNLRLIGTNTHHRPAAAAVRALRLIYGQRPEEFAALPGHIWSRWGPAVFNFFDNDFSSSDTAQVEILRIAYERAPDTVLRAVARTALGPNSKGLSQRALQLIDGIYDRKLGDFLERLRHRTTFKAQDVEGGVWAFLARKAHPAALRQLSGALGRRSDLEANSPAPSDDVIAVAAAERLSAGDTTVWERALSLGHDRPELARAIWSRYANGSLFRDDGEKWEISEDLAAAAYLELERLFPDRPDGQQGRFLRSIDYVEHLQSGLLRRLINRGTAAGVAAVTRIEQALPEATWLRHQVQEAKRNFRAASRRLFAPAEVVKAVADLTLPRPLRSEADAVRTALAAEPPPTAEEQQVPDSPTAAPREELGALGADPVRRLKLLFLASEWRSGRGGVSTVNRELCVALAQAGHDVVCVALEASKEDQIAADEHGVRLMRCPQRTGLSDEARLVTLTSEDLEGFVPEIVFGHDHVNGPAALQVSKNLGARFAHILHTVPQDSEAFKDRVGEARRDPTRGYEKAQAQLNVAREAALVVGIGPKMTDNAVQHLPEGARVYELMPGLNADLLNHKPNQARLRVFHSLMSARMHDGASKGAELACEAMKRAAKGSRGHPKLTLRGFSEGEAEAEFNKFAIYDDYRPLVDLLPYTDEPTKLRADLEESSLVLMPSLSEGFGLSAYEAIAAGVPVILSYKSGLADYLARLADQGIIHKDALAACVVRPHDDNLKLNFDGWAEKISAVMADLRPALDRAEYLRTVLRPILTWRRAAEGLAEEILGMLAASAE